jgi:hypothetical protein
MRKTVISVGVFSFLVLLAASAYSQDTVTLTVNSAYGRPDPSVGVHSYLTGTVITASVATPVLGGGGVRYACVGWKSKGDPEHLASVGFTNNTGPFSITKNIVLTWKWKAQYRLTVNVSPQAHCVPGHVDVWWVDKTVEPPQNVPAPEDGYWDYKKVAQLQAVAHEGYDFAYWSGGSGAIRTDPYQNPTAQQMRRPETVIANFTPEPRNFTVISAQGEPVPAVGTYEHHYDNIVTANCGTTPYSGGTGIQYVCAGHTGTGDIADGPETSISFIIHHDSSVTWLWQTQYYLTVVSYYDNPQGEGWYNEGVTANWSVTSPWPGGTGIQYVADSASGSVLMDAPKTVTVSWTTQYYLTVTSAYGAPTGEGWYNSGATANWSVTSPWPGATGVQYITSPTSGDVLMDLPKTVDVSWTTQYYLTIDSLYGNPQGEGWYNAGTTVYWSVTSPWYYTSDTRYYTSPTSGEVLMNEPKTLRCEWTREFRLTIDSDYGDLVGGEWWEEGMIATWSVTSPWPGDPGVQYIADQTSGSVLMDSPKTVIVTWTTQYYLTIEPPDFGDPQGAGWYDAGTTAHWSVTSPVAGGTGIQYVASPSSGDVVMSSPQTVTVSWTTQYYLTVVSAYGAPTGEGWYNASAIAHWTVTDPVSGGEGIQYVTSPTSGDVVMDSPQTVTIVWTTQYYLTVNSAYDTPVGAGWYDAGTTAHWSVTSPVSDGTGIQYVADPSSGDVLMDSPKTVTVTWQKGGPIVTNITHTPEFPNAAESVIVTAKIVDIYNITGVTLNYSFDNIVWQTVDMVDLDKDNVYEATIPGPDTTVTVNPRISEVGTKNNSFCPAKR